MPAMKPRLSKPVYLKSAALALAVGIVEAVVGGSSTSVLKFSAADFAFAFILTYAIALGVFSEYAQR
jgi:hypothetical protein